ncbi:hypothetical protein ACFQZC_08650 [Streptacidiphilus monticola]
MDGDYRANGTTRQITVSDSTGDAVVDSNWLAGLALETDTYTAANGTIDAKTTTPSVTTTQTASATQTPGPTGTAPTTPAAPPPRPPCRR